ncbi:acyl carrier protein [Salibacterium sp. K-3]
MTNLKEELREMIAEIIEEDDFQDSDDFIGNLGVDSMMALEIIAQIEQSYNITVKEEFIPRIKSLNDVYELVVELLKVKEETTHA